MLTLSQAHKYLKMQNDFFEPPKSDLGGVYFIEGLAAACLAIPGNHLMINKNNFRASLHHIAVLKCPVTYRYTSCFII